MKAFRCFICFFLLALLLLLASCTTVGDGGETTPQGTVPVTTQTVSATEPPTTTAAPVTTAPVTTLDTLTALSPYITLSREDLVSIGYTEEYVLEQLLYERVNDRIWESMRGYVVFEGE